MGLIQVATTDKDIAIAAMDGVLLATGAAWVSMGPTGIAIGQKDGTHRLIPWPGGAVLRDGGPDA